VAAIQRERAKTRERKTYLVCKRSVTPSILFVVVFAFFFFIVCSALTLGIIIAFGN